MLLGVLFVIMIRPFCRRVIAAKKSGYNGFSSLVRNFSVFFQKSFCQRICRSKRPANAAVLVLR